MLKKFKKKVTKNICILFKRVVLKCKKSARAGSTQNEKKPGPFPLF